MVSYIPNKQALSRAQRQRLAAAETAVDRITAADARYFIRFPNRTHRLRHMGTAEREQMLAAGKDLADVPGERWAVAVCELAPGTRVRRFFKCRADADLEHQPEQVAAGIYQQLVENDPNTAVVEDRVRAIIAQRGAAR